MSSEQQRGSSRLRLSEHEILLATQVNGPNCLASVPYEEIVEGIALGLRPEPEEGVEISDWTVEIRLDVVEPGRMQIEDLSADPPSKFFEGTVMGSTLMEAEVGSEVFGLAIPDGFVTFFPNSPDSGQAQRAILAGEDLESLELVSGDQ